MVENEYLSFSLFCFLIFAYLIFNFLMKNINFMDKEKLSREKEIPLFSLMKAKFTRLTSNSEK